ncbi:hypothetical protein PSHO110982_04320 [Pseudostreptobacillus hongkongensis]
MSLINIQKENNIKELNKNLKLANLTIKEISVY